MWLVTLSCSLFSRSPLLESYRVLISSIDTVFLLSHAGPHISGFESVRIPDLVIFLQGPKWAVIFFTPYNILVNIY